MAFEVNSVPWSETIMSGLPRRLIRSVRSRAARRSEIDVSGTVARALARHVIDDVQHAKAPSAGELIVHEVQRSSHIRLRPTRTALALPPLVNALEDGHNSNTTRLQIGDAVLSPAPPQD
jgi:hypothetical protein